MGYSDKWQIAATKLPISQIPPVCRCLFRPLTVRFLREHHGRPELTASALDPHDIDAAHCAAQDRGNMPAGARAELHCLAGSGLSKQFSLAARIARGAEPERHDDAPRSAERAEHDKQRFGVGHCEPALEHAHEDAEVADGDH